MHILRWIMVAQGALYLATGVWPLLHMASFEAVTGPKTDDWLVHTVGLLLAVVGGVLVAAARRREPIHGPVVALAMGVALALAAVECVYVLNGTISGIYLLDTAIEGALALSLLLAWRRRNRTANASAGAGVT